MKKYILLLALSLATVTGGWAQAITGTFSIKGEVMDSITRKPVDYATASLRNAQKQVLKTQLTKTDGTFAFEKLAAGKYLLTVIYVGYGTKTIPVELSVTSPEANLGKLLLSSQSKQLNAVAITADKPLVKQETDRISYDLQADPESKVTSVLEMMRKVPLLTVDAEDNVKMSGNTSYRILINGKPSSMMERNPKDILRSMPASSIQRIEVITTPPAKYDAEGLGGIINIVTNKRVDNGYNGSVNVSQRFPVGGPGVGGSFTTKRGKLGISSYGGASIYNTPGAANWSNRANTGSQPSSLAQNNNRESDSRSGYLGAEISYEIDSLNLISTQLNVNGSGSDDNSLQNSLLANQSATLKRYDLYNTGSGSGLGLDAAINYQLGFKKQKNRLLTFSYRYYGFGNDQQNDVDISNQFNYTLPDYRQVNESNSSEHTFQADYVHPIKKVTVEAGLKGIMRINESDFQYREQNTATGAFETVASRTNTFNNKQNVFSAYNTYSFNIQKWGIKAGVRLENTVIKADFISNASQVNQNYFNLVPSVAINRNLTKTSGINFGYMQRVQRPGIYQLNPFVDRSNPYFETTGNPDLRPSTGSTLQMGYNTFKKGSLNIMIRYTWINSLIFPVSTLDQATNITLTRFENTGAAKALGINFNHNYPITQKWNVSTNGGFAHGWVVGTSAGKPIRNHGFMGNGSVNTGYKFGKGWRANGNFYASTGSLTIQERGRGYFSSSFSASKDIVKDKLSFSASANNPFNKYRTNYVHTFGPDFDQVAESRLFFRTFNTSLNYRFGKLKEEIKKNKRGIKNDDVSN
ncbi:outer membrane beta-barrel protein [Hufsiella ginkgonis]|uniref:TonB-dependent receptor n=1 Tax=Hufsiella ginkgonis TaxID=2695274 RepID=A0A7K1XSR0_9SPHI|nr:outer membrane beta-barrel protein [Hufsiella ginkgonis]MXV13994.1 TonB-dependent receptor [Hufsiella ginkgonis]